VLDGSRSDLQRLQQRLGALVGAWESDAPAPVEDGRHRGRPRTAAGARDSGGGAAGPTPTGPRPSITCADGQCRPAAGRGRAPANWPTGWRGWPTGWPPRARVPTACIELDRTCAEIRRLFAHRHHLVDQVGRLCTELGQGLTELAEDESWARGQAQTLQARLAEGLNARSVRAATDILAETRTRHARVRGEREQARNALKA
jgi:diguanylate cyclase